MSSHVRAKTTELQHCSEAVHSAAAPCLPYNPACGIFPVPQDEEYHPQSSSCSQARLTGVASQSSQPSLHHLPQSSLVEERHASIRRESFCRARTSSAEPGPEETATVSAGLQGCEEVQLYDDSPRRGTDKPSLWRSFDTSHSSEEVLYDAVPSVDENVFSRPLQMCEANDEFTPCYTIFTSAL